MEAEPGEYCSFILTTLLWNTNTFSPELVLAVVLIALLLLCSALVSGAEVAYFSLTLNHVNALRKETKASAKRILRLLEQPRYLLATILISNNFINVAIIIISTFITQNTIEATNLPDWALFMINVVLVTFLLVLFGEVAPKVYANINNIKLARFMARTLLNLRQLTYPIATILVKSTQLIEKRLEKNGERSNLVSLRDIDQAIDLTIQHTKDGEQDAELLKSIVSFGSVSATQIMRARVNVTAVETDLKFDELLAIVRESGYSRIPVYKDSFDNVVGVLYVKDLIAHLDKETDFEWQQVIRPPFFVPEGKKIDDLLKEFQDRRVHMAIVVDEYGGTSGIVTLEDILEELIGDIRDEFDDDEDDVDYEQLDENTFVFEGQTMLNDVCRIMSIDVNIFDEIRGDADSIAGLVLEIAGRIPRRQESVYHKKDYQFQVLEADQRRIKRIKVSILRKVNQE